jgi:hypothetical protein
LGQGRGGGWEHDHRLRLTDGAVKRNFIMA